MERLQAERWLEKREVDAHTANEAGKQVFEGNKEGNMWQTITVVVQHGKKNLGMKGKEF